MKTGASRLVSSSVRRFKIGFTRTEMLVVIGCSAVLALVLGGLLLVSVPRAKGLVQRVRCRSNLAKIGLAMAQYAQDHQGRYAKEWQNNPTISDATPAVGSPTGAWCNKGFDAELQPYLPSRALFVCPADIWLNANLSTWGRRNMWDDTSYGINVMVQSHEVASVGNPAETILLGHTRFEHTLFEDRRSVLWETHQTGNNYLFCDGHVQFLNGTATLVPKSLWRR